MKHRILRIPEIPNDKVVLLNISRCFNATDKEDPIYKRPNLYEMTRKYWKADKGRVELADYVLGVANGIVVAVYNKTKWEYMDFMGTLRVGFTGDPVPDSPYLDLDLTQYVRGQNPVRYVNF